MLAPGQTTSPEGLVYTVSGGAATITGYAGSGGSVTIPATLGGVPVSEVGANAFKDKTAVTGVSFPASLVRIGDSAFNGSGLTSVMVPGGVNAIGVYAFASCSSLLRAEVAEGVVSLGVGMFTNCINLAEVVLPLSLTTIQDGAFQYCYKLASIVIPPAVTTVNQYAFFGCSSLKSIVLPASLATIGNQVFKSCASLVQVAFLGNAPVAGTAIFSGSLVSTVYYGAGRNGWASTFDTISTAAMISPAISAQPQSQTLAPGGAASFSVSVSGVPAPSLQWYRNGLKIAGATGATLSVASAQAADVGAYLVIVTNPQGHSVSSVAKLSMPSMPFPVALGSGLVAHYPFTGNAQDRTSYAAHGTVKGAALTTDRLGQPNAAYSFSGSASTIEVPHAAQQNQLPFTISVWFRSSSPVGQSASADVVGLVGKYSSTSWNGWQLGLDEFNGTINPWYLPSRANNVIGDYDNRAPFESAPFLADARWHQAVFTVDTTGGILYIDGVEAARQGWLGSAVATASTYPLLLGVYVGNTSYYFKGDLDELRLYQRVLTATEVRDLFALEFSGVVPVPPAITAPPVVLPTPVGNSVSICVTASGTAPLSYQWRKGGISVAGATNACFTIAAAQTGDAGSYDCVVSNAAGSVTSSAAVLAVGSAPAITTHPVSQAVPLTSVVGFTVTATGTAPLTYQWRKNGVNFTGAVTASHVMNNLQAADAASYDVVVSNPYGSATSSAASLTLTPPVWFNLHPSSQTVYAGASASFTSAAAGYNTSVTYQWRKDGVVITGATSASLSFSTIAPANAGSYDVIATSYAGSATSNAAVLTVSAVGPTITTQPQGATLAVGGGTTLSVAAVGALPMTFQWRRNGLDLAGATGSALLLSNAQTYQAGDYTALVSNAYGTALSAAARINVIPRVVSYSARVMIESDGAVATFLIEGSLPKKVLLRAVGPGLAPFGLTGLPDPRLELFDRGANLLAVNDDWASTADVNGVVSTTAAAGAFALANGSKDAALVVTLQPGAYTVRALPASGPGGLAYLELYDVDLATGPMSTLPYVGVRGRLPAGGGVVVGGMGSNGRGQRSYLLRAVGPTLGILGALANPSMLVVREGVLVGQNDDWDAVATEAAAAAAAVSRVAAFALPAGSRDAALALTGNLHAGPCTVQVGSGDTVGGLALLELHDLDAARPASFAPLLASPPVPTSVVAGSPFALRVLAHGSSPLSYQWRKDGVPVSGATAASYQVAAADLAAGGSYSVFVSNALGSATSLPVTLTVTADPVAASATHAVSGPAGYAPGSTVTITNTLSFSGAATGLGWSSTLPAGWTLVSHGGAVAEVKPSVGEGGTLEWAWTSIPTSPLTFTYTVLVPAGASGPQQVSAGAIIRMSGELSRPTASPGPLVIPQILSHSADSDANGRISLLELTRVIELYNTRNGTTRTGCYAVATTSTEDGFAIDAARTSSATVTLARYHSADSNRDGKLSLLELTRVIELYNYRSGTTRTGQYKVQAGTEDGFASGP